MSVDIFLIFNFFFWIGVGIGIGDKGGIENHPQLTVFLFYIFASLWLVFCILALIALILRYPKNRIAAIFAIIVNLPILEITLEVIVRYPFDEMPSIILTGTLISVYIFRLSWRAWSAG